MHPWPALPRGAPGCSRCPCSTHTVAVAMRALSTPPYVAAICTRGIVRHWPAQCQPHPPSGACRAGWGGSAVAQRQPVACGSIWDSEHHFGENEDPQNLGHQGASGAVLPYVACGLPNVDVGLTNRPIRNHWNFFSAGTQSPTNNMGLMFILGQKMVDFKSTPPPNG